MKKKELRAIAERKLASNRRKAAHALVAFAAQNGVSAITIPTAGLMVRAKPCITLGHTPYLVVIEGGVPGTTAFRDELQELLFGGKFSYTQAARSVRFNLFQRIRTLTKTLEGLSDQYAIDSVSAQIAELREACHAFPHVGPLTIEGCYAEARAENSVRYLQKHQPTGNVSHYRSAKGWKEHDENELPPVNGVKALVEYDGIDLYDIPKFENPDCYRKTVHTRQKAIKIERRQQRRSKRKLKDSLIG